MCFQITAVKRVGWAEISCQLMTVSERNDPQQDRETSQVIHWDVG